MIKVLVISYHALPMDVVSSYRAKAYCDYLKSYGFSPTLLTHNWEKLDGEYIVHDSSLAPLIERHATHRIIRLPYPGRIKSKSPLHTVRSYLRGDIDSELNASYHLFKTFLNQHLKEEKYDLIISIFSPHFHLKLAYECWQKFRIPYILDFRDLWDNQIVTSGSTPTFMQKLINSIISLYWRKWLKTALFFTTTSKIWIDYLEKLSGVHGYMIRNGHEVNIKSTIRKQNDCFKIICFGRLYPNLEFDVILSALKRFLTYERDLPIQLEMIGIKKIAEFDGKSYFKVNLHTDKLVFKESMPKEELMNYCEKEATVFILPNFSVDNGQFMVKLYDYLALGSPVILAPRNGSDMENVLEDVNGGLATSNVDEIVSYLQSCYDELSNNGQLSYRPNIEKIETYHRRYQVEKLTNLVISRIN